MVQENNNENGLEEEELGVQVDQLLEKGYSQKEIRNQGFSPSLVRQRVRKRTKRLGQPAPANQTNGKGEVSLTVKEKEQVLPEWLAGQIEELYDSDEKTRKVFMAGMSIPLLGMRLFSESFKPMLALMQTYQQGQAEAAKAAQGSSNEVAETTIATAMPYLERMVKEASIAASPNPMQGLFARILEQPMTLMFNNLFGGMFPQMKQPGQAQANPSGLPPGWVQTEQK